jgi:hypothetical protein
VKELDKIEHELNKLDKLPGSTNPRFNRGKKFEFEVKPNYPEIRRKFKTNFRQRADMLIKWCDDNTQGDYSLSQSLFSFVLKSDAMLFKLTWG